MPRNLFAAITVATALCLIERNQEAVFRAILVIGMFYLMNDGTLPCQHRLNTIFGRIRAWLSCPFARFLGDTSFSVYLIHLLFLLPLAGYLTTSNVYLDFPEAGRFLGCLVLVVPPTYLVAWVLHRLIEQPGIRLGGLIVRKAFGDSAALSNAAKRAADGPVV